MEFPVSTISVGATRIPVAGGGYFRIAPLFVTRRAIQSLNEDGHAAVVYLHPWEFDPAQPRIHRAPALSRFRHYLNLSETEPRLRRLLEDFEFAPLREVFRKHLRELSSNAA